MLDIKMDGNRAIIDVREIIKDGAHPRFKIFEYVKSAPVGTTIEVHLPRAAQPLAKGLEDMGLKVVTDELGPGHFRLVTVK